MCLLSPQNQLMSVLRIPVESIGSLQHDYLAVNFAASRKSNGAQLVESDEYVHMDGTGEGGGGTLEFDDCKCVCVCVCVCSI